MILEFGFVKGEGSGLLIADPTSLKLRRTGFGLLIFLKGRVKGFGPRDGGDDCYEQRRTFLLVQGEQAKPMSVRIQGDQAACF